jgi:hypothetical protein
MSLPGRGPFARPWVRIACAVLATAVLGLTVWAAGARAVLAGLGASVHALPALAGLEALMLACVPAPARCTASAALLPAPVGAGRSRGARWDRSADGTERAEATRAILLGRSVGPRRGRRGADAR